MSILKNKTKKDFGLLIAILAVAAVFVLASFPIVVSMINSNHYKTFVDEFTEGINSSHPYRVVMLTKDGRTEKMPIEYASKIYSLIMTVGMGKEQKKCPEGEPVMIEFHDGSKLEFWTAAIKEKNVLRENGLFVRFTASDGWVYQYDSDKMSIDSINKNLPR